MQQASSIKRRYSRLDAVRCQLDMAVRAHLQFDDLVSALTLAGAAERVLSDQQPQNGILGVDAWSIRAYCNLHIKEDHQKAAAKLLRDGYDFLRHADRSPDRVLNLNAETVEIYLLLSIRAYSTLSNSSTSVMTAFKLWMMAERPDWIADDDTPIIKRFSEEARTIRNRSKPEFFGALLGLVESQSLIPNPWNSHVSPR